MKRLFIAFACVVSVGGAALAYNVSAKATPQDLYAKSPGGTCVHLVNGIGDPSSAFSDNVAPGFSAIVSRTNVSYTLWDNAACSTAGTGKQIAFL